MSKADLRNVVAIALGSDLVSLLTSRNDLPYKKERRVLYKDLISIAPKIMATEGKHILDKICTIAVWQAIKILPHCCRPGSPIPLEKVVISEKGFQEATDFLAGVVKVLQSINYYVNGRTLLGFIRNQMPSLDDKSPKDKKYPFDHEEHPFQFQQLAGYFWTLVHELPEQEERALISWLQSQISVAETLYDETTKPGLDGGLIDRDLRSCWHEIEFRFYSLAGKVK